MAETRPNFTSMAGCAKWRVVPNYACDWIEQIGSYLKYGLFDADALLDVNSASINRLWNQLAPAIERMRVTRGETLYGGKGGRAKY